MFTTTYAEFTVKQQEMQRQADHYRLVKSAAGSRGLSARVTGILAELMVNVGQGLVDYAQAAR